MNKGRLLFCNDACHTHLYCFEPPISLEDARLPVDEIAGTKVDTLVYGLGKGPAMFHLTDVGEVFGSHLKAFKDMPGLHCGTLPAWRAYENVMSLKERGVNLLQLLIERAHEKGLEFYASLRQTSGAPPEEVDNYFGSQFKIDHPELCLKGRGKYAFNFAYPEVRAERFALAEETVNRYDVDGFEMDWLSLPYFFEEDEVEQNTPILTEYMREHRRMIDEAAKGRGRSIVFGSRVLPTLEGNLAIGIDVASWVKEGLLDFVVPNYYVDEQMDADFPFEWLVELARGTECKVFPALQRNVGRPREPDGEPVGEQMASPDHYHAAAAAYWSKGADGIYLAWFNWPIDAPDRQVLSEIHDDELLSEKTKHYVIRGHKEDAASRGYTAQLPVLLINGQDAPGQTVRLFIADDPEQANTTLKVRLRYTTIHDSLTVSVNGQALSNDTCSREPHNYTPLEGPLIGKGLTSVAYIWLEYPVPRGVLQNGANQVGVAMHSRPPKLEGQVVLDRVDLIVKHPV